MPMWKHTFLLCLALLVTACAPATPPPPAPATRTDLGAVKSYLLTKVGQLQTNTAALQAAADGYYSLAQDADFDYRVLWADHSADVSQLLAAAKAAWIAASPLYEQMEGIVAGVPGLAEYDLILDAGASGEEDPDNAVPFDLTLPDGRVLPKPGNLFGVTESTLWGTFAGFTIPAVQADLDGNGASDFGEVLPDANVLKAGAAALDDYVHGLAEAAAAWQPTESDAFTALVVMTPTMSEYFSSWKNSRFVAGEESTQRDFVAISRLADIQDILVSLQVLYAGVKPLVATVDAGQADDIEQRLDDLLLFVADVYTQEQGGKRFAPEEADLLGAEAQQRATTIAGQIAQVAAQLNIPLE